MNVLEYIARHEGLRLRPYKCTAGQWTIGYGHKYTAEEMERDFQHDKQMGITKLWAEQLLRQDVKIAELACKKLFVGFFDLSENRQAVLVDMMFNLGERRFRGFKKMIAAVQRNDFDAAANEIMASAYYRQLGGDPEGTDDKREERPEENIRLMRAG
jgi:lysozyme